MPKVSIIVPIYGVENFLEEAINSIIKQSLEDIEIILINDGSKDNCPQIIDHYAQTDKRIVAIHKPNGGYGQTCNLGLSIAKGEYIAIMEPDDYIDSKMYEDLYNIAMKNNSDIVKSCFYDNLQSKQETRIKKVQWKDYIPENKNFTLKEYPYFMFYHPSIWSGIYKKDFLQKHNIKFTEAPGAGWTDNLFQVQTMCLAEKICYTSNAYYYWRRLNSFDSDDLKDYTIPFKRSDEIHQWLEINNIKDENILANLYKRELVYISIVLGMDNIKNKEDCFAKIKTMLERMDKNIIQNNSLISKKHQKFYNKLSSNLNNVYYKTKLKKFRQKFFSIRIGKQEMRIILFGLVFGKKVKYKEKMPCQKCL